MQIRIVRCGQYGHFSLCLKSHGVSLDIDQILGPGRIFMQRHE